MKGNVFDIRRFSTHDGDGIRTTVFLKGCPLSCVWCQNPEGISTKRRPVYFEKSCIHCGICGKMSTNEGVVVDKDNVILSPEKSEDWEQIIDACPSGALRMDSKVMSVNEVLEELKKDMVFYEQGGGVTLSGGEPLLQAEFAVEILKECQKIGIHTAIETSLSVPMDAVKAAMPYLDMMFVDLKIFDDAAHKKYVGMSNEIIKDNLRMLLESEKRENIIVRTPMIPGLTTENENIANISQFISDIYPDVTYEILNYNPLAEAKYHLVDLEFCFQDNPKMYTKEEMQYFHEIAIKHGIKRNRSL